VHVAGEQVETQVFVMESQIAPPAQLCPLPQVTLQRPSPGSHVSPEGHRSVVQSEDVATHWSELAPQTDPIGHDAFDVQPALQASVIGSQYCPGVQPVIEQSGGAG
jgi:hypothetical protein